jgi:D-alanyl-D-alanine dipeptidase
MFSCSSQKSIYENGTYLLPTFHYMVNPDTIHLPKKSFVRKDWIELHQLAPSIKYDIKYATTNNFVNKKVYPCAKCFLRPEVAYALQKIQMELQKKGYGLIIYDCYRPLNIQKQLWKMVPNSMYVAKPENGSMHNRGLAVDLSIVNSNGEPLNMGTSYDSFEKKAHSYYKKLPKYILENRKSLREIMHKYGLEPIRTEWWHYSYRQKRYPLARWQWDCD